MNIQTDIFFEDEGQDMSLPAITSQIEDIVAARDAALAKITEAANTLAKGFDLAGIADDFKRKASRGHSYYGVNRSGNKHYENLFNEKFDADESIEIYRQQLDAAVWSFLLVETGVRDLMDVTGAREFDQGLRGDVPPVTVNDVRATCETWMGNADLTFARGLATAFSSLERRFKSHDAFKIGSRIILTNVFSEFSGSIRHETEQMLIDIERVFAKLDNQAPDGRGLVQSVNGDRQVFGCQQSETETQYFKIRGFLNGNAHLWFTRDDLVEEANKILAAYYGEVLPDAAEKDEDCDDFKKRTNLPSKNLHFYHTPTNAATKILEKLYYRDNMRVLEPSGGIGHLVEPLLAKGHSVTTIEIHEDRVKQLRRLEGRNCKVIHGNFLNEPANPVFDAVIMNPPFYKTHWMDHVRHAFDFLADGGQLIAIVPVTAQVGQSKAHIAFRRWAEKINRGNSRGLFQDMPPESFAETGTNINTLVLTLRKRG